MRLICFILATIGIVTSAHAEFVMVAPPSPEAADSPALSSPSPPKPSRPRPHSRPRRVAPDPALTGFGDQVPLSFAVRQIVPARLQVDFGEQVDREARVDWKGGRPWRPTLSEAIKPLGLRIAERGGTVTIVGAASAP